MNLLICDPFCANAVEQIYQSSDLFLVASLHTSLAHIIISFPASF